MMDHYDKLVKHDDVVTDLTTGESWEATPLEARALDYRDRGYNIVFLTDSEANLSSPFLRGWKTALLTFLLSLLLPVVGTAVWIVWYCCFRTFEIRLMRTYEGEITEKKMSMLGWFMRL